MSKYIDADNFAKQAYEVAYPIVHDNNSHERGLTLMGIMQLLDEQPTADVRENVKGEWVRWYEEIKHDGYTEYIPHCKCPKCETEYDSHIVKFINFCPNCGADMRENKYEA